MPTPEKLKKYFPHASKSFLKANPDLASQLQNPIKQRVCVQSLDEVLPRKTKSNVCAHLSITSFTVRLRDEDNLKGGCKALIDCLTTLHLIDNDDPDSITTEVKQERVKHRKEERTIVQITYELEANAV